MFGWTSALATPIATRRGDGRGHLHPMIHAHRGNLRFWQIFDVLSTPIVMTRCPLAINVLQLFCMQEAALYALGNDGLYLFMSLDKNNDMVLSPEEFLPIVDRVIEIEEGDPSGENVTLLAMFQPLRLESMSKSKDGFLGARLSGLFRRGWNTPVLVAMVHCSLNHLTQVFSFYQVFLHKLLSMFHPRPFVKSRFSPQGAIASIRAMNDRFYEIFFRIHAEFQLNEPPGLPFWFTPAQFTGHITIAWDASHVRDFHLYVPSNRSLNVDMEWLFGSKEQGNMEVDIGHVPQMELISEGPSLPLEIYDENGNNLELNSSDPIQFIFDDIEWESEISVQEVLNSLELFHVFRQVRYFPFVEVFPRARAEAKLVHSILLWGALDDQSCSGRTLRETALESEPVLALLAERFVSSWALVAELEILKKDNFMSKLASMHLEKYTFPVEMMISLPNGTVVHSINANDFLDATASGDPAIEANPLSMNINDPTTATYLKFLLHGVQNAEAYSGKP
uniref:Selenoprotein N n=1 Tax=Eptatretus burgeri TaxID=7764 RepID=A0A8C4N505_EPTBU